jgi:hypothetical protein
MQTAAGRAAGQGQRKYDSSRNSLQTHGFQSRCGVFVGWDGNPGMMGLVESRDCHPGLLTADRPWLTSVLVT